MFKQGENESQLQGVGRGCSLNGDGQTGRVPARRERESGCWSWLFFSPQRAHTADFGADAAHRSAHRTSGHRTSADNWHLCNMRETLQKAGENVRTPHGGALLVRGVCSGRMRGKAVCLSTHPRQHATRTPFPPATCPQPSISRVTFVAYSVVERALCRLRQPGKLGASDMFSFHNP